MFFKLFFSLFPLFLYHLPGFYFSLWLLFFFVQTSIIHYTPDSLHQCLVHSLPLSPILVLFCDSINSFYNVDISVAFKLKINFEPFTGDFI